MEKRTFSIICCLFALLFHSVSHAENVVGFLVPSSGLGDQSFNDMTYAGLIQARSRHDFALIREQSADFTEQSRQVSMDRLIARGANIIVVNGWEYRNIIETYAAQHPQRTFLINDFPLSGLDNVIATEFGQHEGSFLAGALAAWMSKSHKIGFIGGMDIPVIRSFQSGFKEGALYAAPETEVVDQFLSQPEDSLSGFNNPTLGFNAANIMFNEGVDIIFGAAGLTGNGIIQAARQQQKFVIGVDADQDHMAEGYVLTSVMKRLDKATASILNKIFSGEKVHGVYTFGLKEGGISLTPMTYTKDIIPEEVHRKLSLLKQQIIEGKTPISKPIPDRPSLAPPIKSTK